MFNTSRIGHLALRDWRFAGDYVEDSWMMNSDLKLAEKELKLK